MKRAFLFFVLIIGVSIFSFSQETIPPLLKIDFPLFDLPYQIDAMNTAGHGFFSSYANPSMAQSLAITSDMISSFHYGMRKFYDLSDMNVILKNVIFYAGIILGDYLLSLSPFGSISWLHEEYHRAVMSRYGVNSFNTVYVFDNKVAHVTDEDLARFKAESPADFIRMHSSGIEGSYLLVDTLQKNNFFYNKKRNFFSELDIVPLYLVIHISDHIYVMNPDNLDERSKRETTIAERDFTGQDPIGWVYDLFRPNEPYSARGIHPTGTGIDRYRQLDDLTAQERTYFKKVGYWQFVRYISPMVFGFRSLPLGNTDIRWNFSFSHFLASFGTDLSFKVFLNINKFNFIAAYHNYQNYEHTFPAIEIEMIDYQVQIGNFSMYLSPKIMIGVQPKRQNFFTSEAEFFGLIGTRADFHINKHLFPYLEITAKTNGWVAGNEFLEKNIKLILGVSARFY